MSLIVQSSCNLYRLELQFADWRDLCAMLRERNWKLHLNVEPPNSWSTTAGKWTFGESKYDCSSRFAFDFTSESDRYLFEQFSAGTFTIDPSTRSGYLFTDSSSLIQASLDTGELVAEYNVSTSFDNFSLGDISLRFVLDLRNRCRLPQLSPLVIKSLIRSRRSPCDELMWLLMNL